MGVNNAALKATSSASSSVAWTSRLGYEVVRAWASTPRMDRARAKSASGAATTATETYTSAFFRERESQEENARDHSQSRG